MAAPKNNLYALGNHGGRPAVYETPDDLDDACYSYFQWCKDEEVKATVTGLALFLGFADRQSLYDYEKKDEFSCIIKRARLAVQNSYEMSGNAIDIFALKNMGWKDKHEVEHSGQMVVHFDKQDSEL